jgi:hypothetical protein
MLNIFPQSSEKRKPSHSEIPKMTNGSKDTEKGKLSYFLDGELILIQQLWKMV